MTEWLIVRLPRGPEAAVWLPIDDDGRAQAAVQSGPLSAAAGAAAHRRVAIIAPSAEVLVTEVELPHNSADRAAQVVPYALEEQLVADVESQHFAVGRVQPNGRTPVAVVARATLTAWLEQCSGAELRADLVCAEATLLPRLPGYAVALLDEDTLSLQMEHGVSTSVSAPPGGFSAALEALLGSDAAHTALLLNVVPSVWQQRSEEIESVRPALSSLKVQLLNAGTLPWLAAQLHGTAPLNLLQGSFAPRGAPGAHWQRWRIAAMLAGALLLTHVGYQAYRFWSLQHTEHELDAAIAQIVNPVLLTAGASSHVGSVRTRLEHVLLEAQASGDRAGLLPALQVLAQAMNGVPGARVEALNFHDGTLQLKLRTSDSQSMDKINQAMRSAGWQAEFVGGNPVGDAYEGNIQLHGGNS